MEALISCVQQARADHTAIHCPVINKRWLAMQEPGEKGSQEDLPSCENPGRENGQFLQVLGMFCSPVATGVTVKRQRVIISPRGSTGAVKVHSAVHMQDI